MDLVGLKIVLLRYNANLRHASIYLFRNWFLGTRSYTDTGRYPPLCFCRFLRSGMVSCHMDILQKERIITTVIDF